MIIGDSGWIGGQMYYVDLDPVIGSEQGGNRPVLVIQNNIGNHHSPTIIIAPITTRVKKLHQPTHIGIPPYFGLPQNSMAMLEQIRTIDKSRLGNCTKSNRPAQSHICVKPYKVTQAMHRPRWSRTGMPTFWTMTAV